MTLSSAAAPDLLRLEQAIVRFLGVAVEMSGMLWIASKGRQAKSRRESRMGDGEEGHGRIRDAGLDAARPDAGGGRAMIRRPRVSSC